MTVQAGAKPNLYALFHVATTGTFGYINDTGTESPRIFVSDVLRACTYAVLLAPCALDRKHIHTAAVEANNERLKKQLQEDHKQAIACQLVGAARRTPRTLHRTCSNSLVWKVDLGCVT